MTSWGAGILMFCLMPACAKAPQPRTGPDWTGGAGGGTIVISGATPIAASGTIGVNYWLWPATWGDTVAATEPKIAALAPRLIRIGGHNNDNNMPEHFDAAELDRAMAYAAAVGAEPILQVPLLADETGVRPTATDAAAMVTMANVTGQYGVKYFSIGNEPDLYPDQETALAGYTAIDYCADAKAFVPAMKAVDPTIKIVGPDLSWKYQSGTNDWLTQILTDCGDLFDVIAVHRYPFAPEAATLANARQDASTYRTTIAHLRAILTSTGFGDKPLAITETNITYDGEPAKSTLDASPGTVPAGLWTADLVGVSLSENLWTTLYWSISETWTLGLITPDSRAPRPAYHALRLWAEHGAGASNLSVVSAPKGVNVYAMRDDASALTRLMIVNWNATAQDLSLMLTDTPNVSPLASVTVAGQSMTAVELADTGAASAWTYGPDQATAGGDAIPLEVAPASMPSP